MDYFDYFSQIRGPVLTGMNILVAGNGQYPSQDIMSVLKEEGAQVVYWTEDEGDFASEEQMRKTMEGFIEEAGSMDVLVTNFFKGDKRSNSELSSEDLQQLWENNVKRTFCVCNLLIPYLKKRRAGKIINILSTSGKRSFLGANAAECSAASAVIGLTKGYAEQLAPFQVTANCIAAGLIDGEPLISGKSVKEVQESLPMKWQPLQKFGTTKDIGMAAAFLASRFSDYITGYTMDVNGGFYMD
uniref:SDR family NAD(P)-dependent oxidoreductase n=1 Tax=Enterocloster hominis (ex Hitch et al. 2024) TaxID=1917870 RepID=UPI0013EF0DA7|nr:SDR family oxidoreductase [Lachnoclostridium pacaense]